MMAPDHKTPSRSPASRDEVITTARELIRAVIVPVLPYIFELVRSSPDISPENLENLVREVAGALTSRAQAGHDETLAHPTDAPLYVALRHSTPRVRPLFSDQEANALIESIGGATISTYHLFCDTRIRIARTSAQLHILGEGNHSLTSREIDVLSKTLASGELLERQLAISALGKGDTKTIGRLRSYICRIRGMAVESKEKPIYYLIRPDEIAGNRIISVRPGLRFLVVIDGARAAALKIRCAPAQKQD